MSQHVSDHPLLPAPVAGCRYGCVDVRMVLTFFCVPVQCSRMRWMTLQPYGCVENFSTCPTNACTMKST